MAGFPHHYTEGDQSWSGTRRLSGYSVPTTRLKSRRWRGAVLHVAVAFPVFFEHLESEIERVSTCVKDRVRLHHRFR